MRYWLMKSEPDTYSVDDLAKEKQGMWEGCRNYTVRNFMRDQMAPGDQAFFYHSSAKEIGIVGIMELVSSGYPDPTQFDPKSEYFDPKSPKDAPRWLAVDVRLVAKFSQVVPLSALKADPVTSGMQVCMRGQRLSVQPVTSEEWKAVLRLAGIAG